MSQLLRCLLVCAVAVALAASAGAQTFFMDPMPVDQPRVGFRFLHPSLDNPYYSMGTFAGAYELYGSVPVSPKWGLNISIPYGRASWDRVSDGTSYSDWGFGNFYFGTQAIMSSAPDAVTAVSFGVFLPTAEEDKAGTEIGYTSTPQQIEKWYPNSYSLYGNVSYFQYPRGETAPIFGFEAGPHFVIGTEENMDSEFLIHYGACGGVRMQKVAILAELKGMIILSQDVDDFSRRFDMGVAFGASMVEGPFRPHLFYQIPLDEPWERMLNGILGLKLEYVFPPTF